MIQALIEANKPLILNMIINEVRNNADFRTRLRVNLMVGAENDRF